MGLVIEISIDIKKENQITENKSFLSQLAEKYNCESYYYIYETDGINSIIERHVCIQVVEFNTPETTLEKNNILNNQNLFAQNDSFQKNNNMDNNSSSNISHLQMNNNLYSQEFKPLETGGNFSFLSDNKQDVNITKSLDYSSLLSDVYN